MITVTNTMTDPSARPDPMADVTVTLGGLTGGVFRPTPGIWAGGQITKPARTVADANGVWTVTLVGNDRVTNPSNTLYQVVQSGVAPILIQGHDDGATHQLGDLVVTNPAQFPDLQPTVIGPAAALTIGTVQTGTPAAATISGTAPNQVLDLTIPPGAPGSAATVAVGTVSTLAAGTPATVNNAGSGSAAVLNFGIPQGTPGLPGTAATVSVDPTSGTVPYGTPTSVTNTGTAAAAIFKFLIEQVQPGSQILTGTGTPTGTPPDGTLFLDTGNGNVWRYSGGAWSGAPVLNIMGPAGSPTPYELRGDGSPYGTLVPTSAGIYYTDRMATCGAIRWVSTGTTNTSWIVTVGDTGWRDMTALIIDPPDTGTWTPGTLSITRTERRVTVALSMWGVGGNGETVSVGKKYRLWNPISGWGKSDPSNQGVRRNFATAIPMAARQELPPMGYISTSARAGLKLARDTGDATQTNLIFYAADTQTAQNNARLDWLTADPWPTTLPGTPA